MRKIIVMLALVIANFVMEAQVKTPQSSPLAKIEQVVGLTTVIDKSFNSGVYFITLNESGKTTTKKIIIN